MSTFPTMVKHDPPTPASSHSGELHYDLHHLLQTDFDAPRHGQRATPRSNEGVSLLSGHASTYSSPGPVSESIGKRPPFEHANSFPISTQRLETDSLFASEDLGPLSYRSTLRHNLESVHLSGLPLYPGHLEPQETQPKSSYPIPPASQLEYLQYTVQPPQSPPTSITSEHDASTGANMTRRLLARMPKSSTAGKVARMAKKIRKREHPKAPKVKNSKHEVRRLTVPLSQLGEGYDHIPVRDMGAWVNRSPSTRKEEVETRNGYVTRPMNSFMLYRSAYAERTKIWCLQNNHQVVSSVSGSSWPMESQEIRERYEQYAKVERDNHAKAHPGYKFSPSKASMASKKKKAEAEEAEDSDPSDVDDFDYDWSATRKRKRKGKAAAGKRPAKESSAPSKSTPQVPEHINTNQSSYQATNPGKPLPAVISDGTELYGQYYQTTIHPNAAMANVEDVRVRMTEAPGGLPSENHALTGLPGGSYPDLFRSSHASTPAPLDENLDPFLRTHDDEAPHSEYLYDSGVLLHGMQSDPYQHLSYQSLAQPTFAEAMPSYLGGGHTAQSHLMPAWQDDFEQELFPGASVEW